MLRFEPGDPETVITGTERTPAVLAAMRADLELDKPLGVQFGVHVRNLVRGNWGPAVRSTFRCG